MTVREFCLHKTRAKELIGICDPWLRHTVFIDHEDLFVIDGRFRDLEVKSDSWSTIKVVDSNGNTVIVPIHYLEVVS